MFTFQNNTTYAAKLVYEDYLNWLLHLSLVATIRGAVLLLEKKLACSQYIRVEISASHRSNQKQRFAFPQIISRLFMNSILVLHAF